MSGSAQGTIVLKVVNRFWHERLRLVVVYQVIAYSPQGTLLLDMPQYLIAMAGDVSVSPRYPLAYRLN